MHYTIFEAQFLGIEAFSFLHSSFLKTIFLCFNVCVMKRRKYLPLLAVTSLLLSCGGEQNDGKAADEYKNPLNDYEEILVKKSVLESILSLSGIQSTYTTSEDDEKLYAQNGSKAFKKTEESTSLVSAIYSNKIIVDNEIATASTTSNGIKITDSHETKTMVAVLKNPEDILAKGKVSTAYGLYQKTFYKASSAKEFGVSYKLIDGNFANEDTLDYKWNNYLLNKYDSISSTPFNFFRDEEGTTTALYSSSTRSILANPIYSYDKTKSVTSVTSNISSLKLDKVDDEYQLKELHVIKDVDYLSDYFGNPLEDGNVSHSETSSSYFYGQSVFPGVSFGSEEYWNVDAHTPILEMYSNDSLINKYTFENITQDYQQMYANEDYAYKISFTVNDKNYVYRLTDKDENSSYTADKFIVPPSIGFKINDDKSFSFEQENVTYELLVVFDSSFALKSITLSLD